MIREDELKEIEEMKTVWKTKLMKEQGCSEKEADEFIAKIETKIKAIIDAMPDQECCTCETCNGSCHES